MHTAWKCTVTLWSIQVPLSSLVGYHCWIICSCPRHEETNSLLFTTIMILFSIRDAYFYFQALRLDAFCRHNDKVIMGGCKFLSWICKMKLFLEISFSLFHRKKSSLTTTITLSATLTDLSCICKSSFLTWTRIFKSSNYLKKTCKLWIWQQIN